MTAVEAKRTMTVHMLVNAIDEFMSDNQHSRDVTLRWFASYLEETVRIARQVRSDNLDGDLKKLVSAHRLSEIQIETGKRTREILELEREASKLDLS